MIANFCLVHYSFCTAIIIKKEILEGQEKSSVLQRCKSVSFLGLKSQNSTSRRKEKRVDISRENEAGRFLEGMLMGAWHRQGGEGLQERHVHRKFLCGSLSVGWQHFNGGLITIMDTGERTRRENTLST